MQLPKSIANHGGEGVMDYGDGSEEAVECACPGAKDFDFLIGQWTVDNHKLKDRLSTSNSWDSFRATLQVRKILDGLGNIDEFKAILDGKCLEGLTLRLFNPLTEQWSLYWVDNWTRILQPPLIGKFKSGMGEFFAKDTFREKNVLVRFIWSNITEKSARWDQAFSEDNGATWETNWIMELKRQLS